MKKRLLICLLSSWLLGSIVTAAIVYHGKHSLSFSTDTSAMLDRFEVPFITFPIIASLVVSGGGPCGPNDFAAGYVAIALKWSLLGLAIFGISLIFRRPSKPA